MELSHKEDDHDAIIQMWKYIFSFTEMAAIKCVIELKIADTIEDHGSPMTLSQLSSTLNCSPSLLYRILRFLVHRKIFKEEKTAVENSTGYAQTPLSRLLVTINGNKNNMTPLLMLESSPAMLAVWQNLSGYIKNSRSGETNLLPFEIAHGKDLWGYGAANPQHSLLFNEAMACSAGVITSAILEGCGELFNGVETLVDVGGGNGTNLSLFVKACPWIVRAINFDLQHVVSSSPQYENVHHVAGDMFQFVPRADVALLKWILHDWNDEDCIKILKKCKEAIPKGRGKVIIIEAIIDEEKKLSDVGLMFDLVMMAHTNEGRERTLKEWAIQSIIQCFP